MVMKQHDSKAIPWWMLRVWHGMTLPVWLQLLKRHGFAVSPDRYSLALTITGTSVLNSFARFVEQAIYGRLAHNMDVTQPPLFIIGHWRTGTTLLHEMLVNDDNFSYPTTYQCMAPHHFLHTSWFFNRFHRFLLTDHRPMDNMPIGWRRPQEDEFALCNLGVPSPYTSWAFPNHVFHSSHYVELEGLTEKELQSWKSQLLWFVKRLTLHDPRRLVLKSPTHTARVKTILELFPDAQFIHMVRDPYDVVPSTIRTWQRMSETLRLQSQSRDDFEDYVLGLGSRMYRQFDQDHHLLKPTQLCEVRYEDLVADPLGQTERVYEELSLGHFSDMKPKLEDYLEQTKGYQTNTFDISDDLERKIASMWSGYIDRYGYAADSCRVAG